MKRISLVCMLCLLHLASAICECGNGQQSVIPSTTTFNPPSPFNGTDGSLGSFGNAAGCVDQEQLKGSRYSCNGNADNPLFDCNASNNSYYGWDRFLSATVEFGMLFHSMNILVTFLISTSSNVSAPASLQYAAFIQNGMMPADPVIHLPINLPEGPYQHNYTLSSYVMFDGVVITVTPNTTFQWLAINRIIFCPTAATTEDHSSSTISLSTSVTTSSMITPDQTVTSSLLSTSTSLSMSSTVSPTISSTASPIMSSAMSPTISFTVSPIMSSSVSTVSPIVSTMSPIVSTMSPAVSPSVSAMSPIVSTVLPSASATMNTTGADSPDNGSSFSVGAMAAIIVSVVVIFIITVIVVVIVVVCKRKKSELTKPEGVYYSTIDEKMLRKSPANKPGPVYIEMNDGQDSKEPEYLEMFQATEQADQINMQDNPAYSVPSEQVKLQGDPAYFEQIKLQCDPAYSELVKLQGDPAYSEQVKLQCDPAYSEQVKLQCDPAYSEQVKLQDNPAYSV